MMENTSASSLTGTPYLAGLATTWATSSAYSGVTDPSLPNYIALTSGGAQSIGCDCYPSGTACNLSICSNDLFTNDCNCGGMTVTHLADQLDGASLAWREYGESMGTACNTTDASPYAVRHIPFLYYGDVLNNSTSGYCASHVVDYSDFAGDLAGTPAVFSIISPNLSDDMHGTGLLQTSTDITNGDTWLSNNVPAILSSPGFTDDGVLFIVWDEGTDSLSYNDVPFYLLSPLAKTDYVSSVAANHYSLLATIQDGLNLTPRLGSASGATPLADFFPAN
jgi:acid phosphatase